MLKDESDAAHPIIQRYLFLLVGLWELEPRQQLNDTSDEKYFTLQAHLSRRLGKIMFFSDLLHRLFALQQQTANNAGVQRRKALMGGTDKTLGVLPASS